MFAEVVGSRRQAGNLFDLSLWSAHHSHPASCHFAAALSDSPVGPTLKQQHIDLCPSRVSSVLQAEAPEFATLAR